MSPETLAKLQELRETASTIQQCEVTNAKSALANAERQLQIAKNAKRAMIEALQGAIDQTVSDLAHKAKPGESAEIVRWFTSDE